MFRSILLFPSFENQFEIDQIRAQYDSLATHIRPHISLVFPFESSCPDVLIIDAVKRIATQFGSFAIQLSNVGGAPEAGYVWLEVANGSAIITALHDALYQQLEFSRYLRADLAYIPHVTIGQGLNEEVAKNLLSQLQAKNWQFETVVNSISIEHILKNDDSDEFAQIYFETSC
ncbi:2'-5' RNA ligase family protein [Lapidilactobacillus bayanensis]|uniref:2'-5' RNA ligase family protein n=1 Tax=Lapidilactobacillus bayanensis TaxID=2485998 RepID=UPI000F767FD7|nr:2'-5' RNA ligase family protein [Lapidilactobacillus bayanensis]